MSIKRCLLLCILSFVLVISTNACATTVGPHYALTDTMYLAGPVKWDYLTFDSKAHRLFVTRGESVDVLDVITKKIVGIIHNTHGVHGVALAADLGKGFTSNGKTDTVTIFDLKTLYPVTTLPTGSKPDAIVYDPSTRRVFVANGDSSDMTVINAKNDKVMATIKLGGQPEFAVVDGKGRLYINLEDQSQLLAIDTNEMKIISRYNLAPSCDGPAGLAIDAKQGRLFSTCGNKMMVVVDAATGKIFDTLPIGAHSDAAVFDAVTQTAFSSNGDGTLTVVGEANDGHYKVMQTVQTRTTARTMALDPLSHAIYLTAAKTDEFDPATENHPESRPHIKPDTFMILTVGQK